MNNNANQKDFAKSKKTRGVPRAGLRDEEKILKETKIPSLCNIKARVDTRWRKDDEMAPLEVPTRSMPLKDVPPTQTREINTMTTKSIENKLQQIKIVNEEEKPIPIETKLKAAPEIQTEEDENVVVVKDKPSESCSTATISGEVRNIDAGDKESLFLVPEYVIDIYEYLFKLEVKTPIRKDHLADQEDVTPRMRAVLLDWINEVHSQLHLVLETFHMSVSIVDRYLQEVKDTNRSQLQLVGVTALFLAAKYEELFPPMITDCVYITDNMFTQKQVTEMEVKIFYSLDYNLSRPVSIQFLRRFSKAADVEDLEHAMAKYFLELAAIEYKLASCKPSEIAAASLFLSLHLTRSDPKMASGFNNSYWNPTLEHYSRYNAKQLRPIARKIAKIARHAPKAKLNAVYTKYQASKLLKVSLRPELYGRLMSSLVEDDSDA